MKKLLIFVFILILSLIATNVKAQQGCCSYHGGVSYCGDNGYYICIDGTQSPSCVCSSANSSDFITLTDTSEANSNTCSCDDMKRYQRYWEETKEEKYELEEKVKTLENYQFLFWTTLVIFIIYYIYKNGK